MTAKELNKIIKLMNELKRLSEKYDLDLDKIPENQLMMTEDVYDKICAYLKVDNIDLFGVA